MINRKVDVIGFSISTQRGAVLIVALIVLALVSVIGVANMQSATLEMKMIASTMDRNKSFSVTEAALTQFEESLRTTVNDLDDLFTDVCTDSDFCFDEECGGGWCFRGVFNSSMAQNECELTPGSIDPWRTSETWSDGSKYQTIMYKGIEVKGMYEFLCFVDSTPLFRVTVFLDGEAPQSPVMLQSTYAFHISG